MNYFRRFPFLNEFRKDRFFFKNTSNRSTTPIAELVQISGIPLVVTTRTRNVLHVTFPSQPRSKAPVVLVPVVSHVMVDVPTHDGLYGQYGCIPQPSLCPQWGQ